MDPGKERGGGPESYTPLLTKKKMPAESSLLPLSFRVSGEVLLDITFKKYVQSSEREL